MNSGLPKTWCRVRLGDVISYGQTEKTEPDSIPEDAWVLELEDIQKDTSRIVQRLTFGQRQSKSTKNRFDRGDVLYGKLRPYLNKVVIADSAGFCTTEIIPIKGNQSLDARYLFHWLRHPQFLEYVNAVSHGVNMPRLGTEAGNNAPLVLAPLAEQIRIADKLDTLLSRIDDCRRRLERMPELLKRFRRSVLAAACTGKLTESWRIDHASSSEMGGVPTTWQVCKIKDAGKIQLGRQRAPKFHSGPHMRPYLRVQNVFEDRLDLSDVMEMEFSIEDFERYKLHYGDILLNEGQSPEFLGRPAMYRGELPGACFTNTLIRFQACPHVRPEFALLVFRHHMHSGRYRAEGNITTNIAHLGAGRFGEVEFPLPSIEEQDAIILRTASLFYLAARLEAHIMAASKQSSRLTPSLLAKAFRGELVPQDQSNEPANGLIKGREALQAEAISRAQIPRRGRRRQRAA